MGPGVGAPANRGVLPRQRDEVAAEAAGAAESERPPVSTSRGKLDRLTSLRACAALYVFLFHLNDRVFFGRPWPLNLGYSGVIFFFVLSGFVLTWSYSPGRRPRDFYVRRAARIYPLHAVMTAIAYLLPYNYAAKTIAGAVLSTTLVQAWFWNDIYAFSGNSVSWSLSCEVLFYLAFPLVILVMVRLSEIWRWVVAFSCFVVTGIVTVAISRGVDQNVAYHLPLLRFSEFLLGIAGALALRSGQVLRVNGWMVAAVVGVGLVMSNHLLHPETTVILSLPCLAVIMFVAQSEVLDRKPRRVDVLKALQWRPLVYCGEVSFAFYLVHHLLIDNLTPALHLRGWSGGMTLFAACSLAAVALHHLVEKRAFRWLLRNQGRRHRTI